MISISVNKVFILKLLNLSETVSDLVLYGGKMDRTFEEARARIEPGNLTSQMQTR